MIAESMPFSRPKKIGEIMVMAVVIAIGVMLAFAHSIRSLVVELISMRYRARHERLAA